MNKSPSSKTKQNIEAFQRRRRRWQQVYEMTPDLVAARLHQQAAQAQAPPQPAPGPSIEVPYMVVRSEPPKRHVQALLRIKALQQAVFKLDWPMGVALALAVSSWYGSRALAETVWLASWLISLHAIGWVFMAIGFWILKFVWAAGVPCPSCREPYGSASLVPFTVGGSSCQYCGLPMPSEKNDLESVE